jgi:DNA-directed RNA polymerase specialized sigma24 family protein
VHQTWRPTRGYGHGGGRCPGASEQRTGVAFADFYGRELAGQVRRAALLLGSDELANDVVHDAFVAVYRRWDALDEPGPYLNVAVLNGCRGIHRRRSRYERLVPRLLDRAASESVGDRLDDVLAQLPFNQRAAVVLRFYGGLTTDEIARARSVMWLHRGAERASTAWTASTASTSDSTCSITGTPAPSLLVAVATAGSSAAATASAARR